MLSYVSCMTGDEPPKNAFKAGFDDGPSYHARGVISGKTIPGKVGVRSENNQRFVGACIPYGSEEHRINSFEVLTVDDLSAVSYVRCKAGDPPPENAVQGGFDGGPSYHARGEVKGTLVPGKVGVQGTSDKFYLKGACIPFGSREHRIDNFEVLVRAKKVSHPKVHMDRGEVPTKQNQDEINSSCPVFLSYQWDLQETVKGLKSKIDENGVKCWMDIGQMGGGDSLLAKIDAGIRGCKVFVCCVTKKYCQSETCQNEATLAHSLKKPIIPLLFDDISWPPAGQLSMIFAKLLYIKMTGKDAEFQQLMTKVKGFINPEN